MQYTWRCEDCNQDTDVTRALKDMDIPPEGCDRCNSNRLYRVILPKQGCKGFILEGTGWHETDYGKRSSYK
jgi:predicted nucleic acid-binding Zn ribbon protein